MEKHENLLTNTITPAYIGEISARLTAYRSSLHGHSPRPNDISFDLMCGHYTQAFAALAANAPFDLEALLAEISRYQAWVNDLQSGMYVNCVYCGHRYGPEDEVPSSMADALKQHIESCPQHPMSQLKKQLEAMTVRAENSEEALLKVIEALKTFPGIWPCHVCKNNGKPVVVNDDIDESSPCRKCRDSREGFEFDSDLVTVIKYNRENKPLTLDELKQMNGEPVWIVWLDGRIQSKWWIVGSYEWNMMEFFSECVPCDCGITWIPYRSKTEGTEK